MEPSTRPCCSCQCSCHDSHILVGQKAIGEWVAKLNLPIGRSPKQLRRYTNNLGFPTWVNRYGRICLFPEHGMRWFLNFQNKEQWWPNGRRGRKNRIWQEQRSEAKEQME